MVSIRSTAIRFPESYLIGHRPISYGTAVYHIGWANISLIRIADHKLSANSAIGVLSADSIIPLSAKVANLGSRGSLAT